MNQEKSKGSSKVTSVQWAEKAPIQISIAPGKASLRKEKQK